MGKNFNFEIDGILLMDEDDHSDFMNDLRELCQQYAKKKGNNPDYYVHVETQ